MKCRYKLQYPDITRGPVRDVIAMDRKDDDCKFAHTLHESRGRVRGIPEMPLLQRTTGAHCKDGLTDWPWHDTAMAHWPPHA